MSEILTKTERPISRTDENDQLYSISLISASGQR